MTQVFSAVSCIVNSLLILTILKCIVDDSFSVKKPWLVICLAVFLGIAGGFADTHLGGNFVTGPTNMFFPLMIYLLNGKKNLLRRCGKYLLGFLFFMAVQLISVFIGLIIMPNVVVVNVFTLQMLIISSVVNIMVLLILSWVSIKKKIYIVFSKTEWFLLLAVVVIISMLINSYSISGEIDVISTENLPETLRVIINYSLLYVVIFLYLFFIVSLISGKITSHFKKIGEISQAHMEQQLEYFSAYREAQEETRRFRHDMKNHFLYLHALSQEKKIDEMQDYIDTLAESWQDIPFLVSTGNPIADTVIHGKGYLFEQNDIVFRLDGAFTSKLEVSPIDLCTIFANAIDNAVEANIKFSDSKERYLNIFIKSSNNHYLISFENPVIAPVHIVDNHVETDKKGDQHGYGLRSIERSADKYGGYLQLNNSREGVFVLEIVIPK